MKRASPETKQRTISHVATAAAAAAAVGTKTLVLDGYTAFVSILTPATIGLATALLVLSINIIHRIAYRKIRVTFHRVTSDTSAVSSTG